MAFGRKPDVPHYMRMDVRSFHHRTAAFLRAIAKMLNAMMSCYRHAEYLPFSVTNIPPVIIDDSAYHKVSVGCRALAQDVGDSLKAGDY